MAQYPNNYRVGAGQNPNYTYIGRMPLYSYNAELGTGAGSRLNWQIGDQGAGFARTASCPDGYGMKTPFPPVKAGSISAWNDPVAQLSMTGDMLAGGPMQGTGDIAVTGDGSLSLVVSLSGTSAVVTLAGEGMVLRLTVGLNGNGTFQLVGDGNNLAMIVPFEGAGSVVTMGEGATDLRGLLALEGEWTPFTELSPEGLANAVWSAMAASANAAGTMGEKLNDAGSAANPWTEVIESGYTAAQVLRLIAAAIQGDASGLESGVPVFKSIDGSKNRIEATYANGTRTVTDRDAD